MSKLLDAAEKEKRACVCAFTYQEDNFTAATGIYGNTQHIEDSIVALINALTEDTELTLTETLARVNVKAMTGVFIRK